MLSPKRLVEKAKKGIPLRRTNSSPSSYGDESTTVVADKGHFFVYSMDDTRFIVPLTFLKSPTFQKLLKMSEEEFGLPGNGPITLPCSATFMECIISLLNRSVPEDAEKALLASLDANHCSLSSLVVFRPQGIVV